MEKELAEALRDQREIMTAGFARMEAIIDKCREDAAKHYLEDARMFARLESSLDATHKRLDEHLTDHSEDRKNKVQLWIGVILAAISSIGAMMLSIFRGQKP